MEKFVIENFVTENFDFVLKTLKDLCLIPAPSHYEDERAKYCKDLLDEMGAEGVYIDEAKNVVCPINCDGSDKITVFVAHTDTVFPDTEPMPYKEENGRIYCPGVGDDTSSVSVLLATIKYLIENKIKPQNGVLFVLNSCEEGLGNLKGTRAIFEQYKGRIEKFVSFDSHIGFINNVSVGSHRYEVEVSCGGGHSFQMFGKKNAIAALSEIITEIYKIEVPKKGDSRTSYNVGTIEGGTSVNTIAQSAKMLCEYRSDNVECLEIMQKNFKRIFEKANGDDCKVYVNKIGDRPCGAGIDENKQKALADLCSSVISEITGEEVKSKSASTDCNIPHSLGIPAVCIGVFEGEGSHTREEYIVKDSLKTGLKIAIKTVLELI